MALAHVARAKGSRPAACAAVLLALRGPDGARLRLRHAWLQAWRRSRGRRGSGDGGWGPDATLLLLPLAAHPPLATRQRLHPSSALPADHNGRGMMSDETYQRALVSCEPVSFITCTKRAAVARITKRDASDLDRVLIVLPNLPSWIGWITNWIGVLGRRKVGEEEAGCCVCDLACGN
ncbi:hypothetical protein C2845_PM09G15060 [Panicum miliaceum]|uniref:Uncharacterized protein n=1 Tax=Panicum miliaceum TaxID=4540 RepID=A0A3L6S3H2_PANMI|nr:hypothetical protein C2845_PM09G15060 [Panicum miliaceum]